MDAGRKFIPDLDIYRTANILVEQHGRDAPIQAAMLEKGDLEGYAVWKRVQSAPYQSLEAGS